MRENNNYFLVHERYLCCTGDRFILNHCDLRGAFELGRSLTVIKNVAPGTFMHLKLLH